MCSSDLDTALPLTEKTTKPETPVLVQKSVPRALFSMAFPMLAGTFAMNAYGLTDAWFVAQLGTLPLAAMGYIFPVVMLLTCVARGVGAGVTVLVANSVGRSDHSDAARVLTHGVVLTVLMSILMSIGGYLLLEPLFLKLGADQKLMPLIRGFMVIWYIGAVSMSLPMLGSGVLISVGDSKAASLFMIVGTLLNLVLNPIMIFGYFGWPAMGIRGSAMATVVAQTISTVWLMDLFWRKHRLFAWSTKGLGRSARRITRFAVPSILSLILMPISASIITKILSGFGHEAVAASGAAGRIEMFAFVVPMALGISLTPFVSQNFGAGCMDRVRQAQRVSTLFALGYGAFVTVAFFAGARWLASVFTDDPKVADTLVLYIRIISFGYGMMEVHRYCGFFLTGMYRPAEATVLNAVRVIVLLIPCSYIGAHYWGIAGLFGGRLLTDIVVGCIGLAWVAHAIRHVGAEGGSRALPQRHREALAPEQAAATEHGDEELRPGLPPEKWTRQV